MMNCASSEQLLSKPFLASEIDRELAERNLRDFVRLAWHVVEPSTSFMDGWHIDAITDHLQAITRGEIRNLLINVPPRHMKSLLVSVFWPCWEWLRCPQRRWLFSSYAASLSIRDSVKCRRLIESPWYQANWGDRFALTGDQNAKARFENDRTGYRLSTSVGGAATGEGGDRIICDDPHNVHEAESDAVRKATLDWWDVVMSTRLNNPKTAAKVIVMQRCHQLDLSGHLLEQGGWEHLCLPAEHEGTVFESSIGWTDPREQVGELLWPERFGIPEIADLKRSLGSYAAAGQLQQRPSPAEGGILKRHWWRYWEPVRSGAVGATLLPQRFDEVVISVPHQRLCLGLPQIPRHRPHQNLIQLLPQRTRVELGILRRFTKRQDFSIQIRCRDRVLVGFLHIRRDQNRAILLLAEKRINRDCPGGQLAQILHKALRIAHLLQLGGRRRLGAELRG
jgi:hypothetical protein